MPIESSNKTIAKNTLMLYIRMFITMIVSLFTSRVILQTLGVDDYGLFQSVGGIVGFMGFLNGALATGTSRFITYSLGKGDENDLQVVFSTTLTIHVLLAILIVILAETIGLWFLHHKLIIPADRMSAAVYCYHLSILSAVLAITQVPYSALIISHERMNVYAYASIAEVVLKLVIVYALYISSFDKLKVYATLFTLLSIGFMTFYRGYCIHHFKESHYRFVFNKNYIKEIGAFSGWSLLTNGVNALNAQGIILLLNMFFSPAIVAARAISLQVNGAVMQFVNNFRTAINPQITKRLASGNKQGSKDLVMISAKFSFFIVLVLAFPIIFTTEALLKLWLGQVPEYSVRFVQLVLIDSLFYVLNSCLYSPLFAAGKIKENALVSTIVAFLSFVFTYIFLRLGYSPLIASYFAIVKSMIIGIIVKPIMLVRIVDYKWRDFVNLFVPCILVTICALPIPLIFYLLFYKIAKSSVWMFLAMAFVAGLSVSCSVWFIGLTSKMKDQVIRLFKNKFVK